jgi:hypothetical protein
VKYQVKLKSTVTAWVDVEIDDSLVQEESELGRREWAADDAVDVHSGQLRDRLTAAGLEFGPIELAHEELEESVRTAAADHQLTPHAQQEIAALTRIAADPQQSPAHRAVALLTAHQRFDAGSCLCGWAKLGNSHAGHQADMLASTGLLVEREHGQPDASMSR